MNCQLRRIPYSAVAFVVLCSVAACGGGGGGDPVAPPPAVSISISPTSSTVNAGATQAFSATIVNSTNTGVSWSASGGTIAGSGLSATYTAPLGGGPYTITATSAADATKSATATVTVTPVSISISPTTITVGAGGTQQFTATVANSTNSAVTWSASGGTIVGAGATATFTAPVSGGAITVTAASVADPSKTAVSNVTVTPVAITVSPTAQTLYRGEPVTLTAAITGTTQTGVTWTATCGTVSGTGASVTYTAPETPGACTVTARSALDATKTAPATLTVRPAWRVATFTDETFGDCTYARCTLRDAITAANAQPNTDTIRIVNTTPTTITLTSSLPTIVSSMHIVGPGPALLTINANGSVANPRRGLFFDNDSFTGSLSGMTIRGSVTTFGGAIVIRKANIALTDVTIVQNELRDADGAGLVLLDRAQAQLLRVIIDSNRVVGTGHGGGLSVLEGSVMTMSRGRVSFNTVDNGWGGGVHANFSTITMDSVTVQGNRVVAGTLGGGGMFIDAASTAQLTRVTVADNSALTAEGGGLRLLALSNVTLTNSTISGNRASLAAGIGAGNLGSFTVSGGTISGNTAATRGGGVFLWGTTDASFTNVTIRDNVAESSGGGGLYMQNTSKARLTDVTLSGNRALSASGFGNGGAVAAFSGTTIIMTNGSIADNIVEASVGAGLWASTSTVTLTGVTIRNNGFTTIGGGGGVWVEGGTSLTMTGGVTRDNRAKGGAGGGILVINSSAQLSNVEVTGNTADLQGGGLQVAGASTVQLLNVTMTGNSAIAVAGNNNSGFGGGIGLFGTSTLTITGSSFSNNSAGTSGGAVNTFNSATLTVTDSRFTGNTAQSQGGAMQLTSTGSTTLRRVTVSGNTATTNSGGGITNGSVMVLENSTISGNTSAGTGGGVFSSSTANSTIRNSTFSANTGVIGGGLGATGIATLNNVTLVANIASDFGGGIGSNNSGAVTIANSLLSGNLRVGAAQNCGRGGAATMPSTGNNLSDDATCTTFTQPTDKNNIAAGISATLADNGGPTRTHALLTGSAAINAGNAAACIAADQRGFSRVGVCDIGAFEFGGVAPAPLSGIRTSSPFTRRAAAAATSPLSALSPFAIDRFGGVVIPQSVVKLR